MKPNELAEKVEGEHDLHETNMQAERDRHEKELSTLKRKAGIHELAERAETVRENTDQYKDDVKELRNLFFKLVHAMCPRQKQTADKQVSIRDGSIFKYNKSREYGLAEWLQNDKAMEATRKLVDKENREVYDKMLKVFDGWKIDPVRGYYRGYYINRAEAESPMLKELDGYDTVMATEENNPRKIMLKDSIKWDQELQSKWRSRSHPLHRFESIEAINVKTDNPVDTARLVRMKDAGIEAYDKVIEMQETRRDDIKTAKKEVKKLGAKHLVVMSL